MSSRTCNLGCKYCFAGEGEYGSVEYKPKQMNGELYMKALEYISTVYPEGVKSISFFGGEPLLAFQEIKEFLPRLMIFCENNSVSVPEIGISTNGTLLTDTMLQFLRDYPIKIVLSLDGPKDINDMARVSKMGGFSVHDAVIEAAERIRKHGIGLMLQMTINKHHIVAYEPGRAVNWLQELETLQMENMAIVPAETDYPELRISTMDDLAKLDMLTREMTNYYIDKLYEEDPVIRATGMLAPIVQLAKRKYVESCTAGHSVFVDTDGSLYPCQMFCNDDSSRLGNVLEGTVDPEKIHSYANVNRLNGTKCASCIAQSVCSFWCKGIQQLINNDMYEVLENRCTFQIANMEECLKALIRLDRGSAEYRRFWHNLAVANERVKG